MCIDFLTSNCRKTRIFGIMTLMSDWSLYLPLTLCKISEKSNDWILRYFEKCWFLGQIWPFDPIFGTIRIFEKFRLCHCYSFMIFSIHATDRAEFIGPLRQKGGFNKNLFFQNAQATTVPWSLKTHLQENSALQTLFPFNCI